MLNDLAIEANIFFDNIKGNVALFCKIIGALWLFNLTNWATGSKLNYLGVIPRHYFGLIGIFTGTFLHKNFNHLFFNSIPLVALGIFMLSFGLKTFFLISLAIMLMQGSAIWLVGRPGIHMGASSLISGYFAFLLISAFANPSFTSIIIALVTIYYFGSILLGIFPTAEQVSWEGHLFGFIAGIIAYYFMLPQL